MRFLTFRAISKPFSAISLPSTGILILLLACGNLVSNAFIRSRLVIKKFAKPYIIIAPKSPIMLVYDVMETDGRESPKEFPDRMFGEYSFEVKGRIDLRIFEGAVLIAQSLGIPVSQKPLHYFKGGYVTTAVTGRIEIYLQEEATVEENFTVLLHELANILLGHTGHKELRKITDQKLVLPERLKISRSTEELEEETVSYLISAKLR